MGVDLQKDFKELAREFRKAPLIEDQYAKQKQFHELMICGSHAVERIPELAEAVPLCEGLFKDERLLVRWIELVNELCKRHPADLEALKLGPEEGDWMYLSPSRTISSPTSFHFAVFQHLCGGFKELGWSKTADDLPEGIEYRIWVKEDQFRETANTCADACELLAREYAEEAKPQPEPESAKKGNHRDVGAEIGAERWEDIRLVVRDNGVTFHFGGEYRVLSWEKMKMDKAKELQGLLTWLAKNGGAIHWCTMGRRKPKNHRELVRKINNKFNPLFPTFKGRPFGNEDTVTRCRFNCIELQPPTH